MTNSDPMKWTDQEVLDEMNGHSKLNLARQQFSFGCARIEQTGQQRKPLSAIEMRRMEFAATLKIIKAWTD